MEFKQLEAFVAVVDYGSFSEAARRLYLTQPHHQYTYPFSRGGASFQAHPAHHQKNHSHHERLSALRQCCPDA